MSIKSFVKNGLVSLLKLYYSNGFISRIAKFIPLKKFIQKILFPRNEDLLFTDVVRFENIEFIFTAPFKILQKAKATGIEARITRLAMSTLRQGGTALDIGANYGFITSIMGKCVGANGKVYSFEPSNDICEALMDTLARNGLSNNCCLIQKAAGKSDSDAFVTVDTILKDFNVPDVDFMKIDVDGSDYDVLLGARQTIERYHPTLVVEMHKNQELIYDFLDTYGYSYLIGMDNEKVVKPKYPLNLIASVNPIKIPPRGFFTS